MLQHTRAIAKRSPKSPPQECLRSKRVLFLSVLLEDQIKVIFQLNSVKINHCYFKRPIFQYHILGSMRPVFSIPSALESQTTLQSSLFAAPRFEPITRWQDDMMPSLYLTIVPSWHNLAGYRTARLMQSCLNIRKPFLEIGIMASYHQIIMASWHHGLEVKAIGDIFYSCA